MIDKFAYRIALALVAGFCLMLVLTATALRAEEDAHSLINALGPANFQQADEIVKNPVSYTHLTLPTNREV